MAETGARGTAIAGVNEFIASTAATQDMSTNMQRASAELAC